MATTPMDIKKRPFSIEYYTKTMLPDGIFDTALKRQYITCYYTNTSGNDLANVTLYVEGVSDPGITVLAQTHTFPVVKAGASVNVRWLGNFEMGSPGKKLVSFIAMADGMESKRTLKNIFVSQTRRDPVTGDYTCTIEEGVLKVSGLQVIGPKEEWRSCKDKQDKCKPSMGPWIPSKVTMAFHANPPYAGIHGDLPFSDPWWKVLAWIVFAIASIVAIVAAADGEGTASTSVGGTFDETTGDVDCCTPSAEGTLDDGLTIAGVASAIATGALIVGLSDEADPWWRGQEKTPPVGKSEKTHAERVVAEFRYPGGALIAGAAYPVEVAWKYQRFTNVDTYAYSVAETQTNTHISDGVEISVPATYNAFSGPLIIETKFLKTDQAVFKGDELYAFILLRSPDGMHFYFMLADDGIRYDAKANDGVYTIGIPFEKIYRELLKRHFRLEGTWKIYAFAQDVNDATPDMLPEIAAQHIGGMMVASAIDINFDPSLPCPLKAQATVNIVT